MPALFERLNEWQNSVVVVDLRSPFVAIGTLVLANENFLEMQDTDLHDLRDTETTRENYVVKVARYGVESNRKRLILRMDDVLAVAKLEDIEAG